MRQVPQYFLLGALLLGLALTYSAFVQQQIVWGVEYTVLAYLITAVPYCILAGAVRQSRTRVALAATGVAIVVTVAWSAMAASVAFARHITVGEGVEFLNMAVFQSFCAALAWSVIWVCGAMKGRKERAA